MYGIVGYGVVGKSTHKGILKDDQNIAIYDTSVVGSSISNLKNSKYIFFCIPTNDDNDVKVLIKEIENIKEFNKNFITIIRSTVPPKTCQSIESKLNEKIIYIPEFVRDRCWEDDCKRRPYIVGHSGISLPKFILDDDIIECSLEDAEILKMFSNNLAALKITFANHMYDLAKTLDADYDKVVEMYDTVKVNQSYLEANENLRGYGGKCLPKDLDFLINTFDEYNIKQTLLTSIKEDNSKWKINVRKY